MASSKTNARTSAKVAGLATQADSLNRNSLSLMGLYGAEGSLSAMVRLPGGRIRKVKPGSRLASGRVVGIDAKGLLLEKNGKTERIVMPGG